MTESLHQKIAWKDGMLLKPEHFQRLERYHDYQVMQSVLTSSPYRWGLLRYTIQHDMLALGKINVTQASGYFPDGSFFHFPDRDLAPPPLSISTNMIGKIIALTLPAQVSIESDRARYQDSNTHETQQLKINLGLLDAINTHECQIPIAKIKEVQPSGEVILDPDYWPSMLDIQAFNIASDLIFELTEVCKHRCDTLAARLVEREPAMDNEFNDLLLLQILNHYSSQFIHLCRQHPLHPELLYRILISFNAELATYLNENRQPTRNEHYCHEDLAKTLLPITSQVTQALNTVLERHAKCIQLESREQGIWFAKFDDKQSLIESKFILRVTAENSHEVLRQQFPAQIKLAPIEYIPDLVKRALPGIGIKLLPIPPRQIPQHHSYTCFEIDKTHTYWQALLESSGLGLHVSGHFPGLQLELWLIQT